MRWMLVIVLLGCAPAKPKQVAKADATSEPQPEVPAATSDHESLHKPPDEMDERMRHCPLALDGATSTLTDIDGGVRFTIKVPDSSVKKARQRARHLVDFAAKRTREGHGEFGGKGGGRMKNCPVVTDHVTIEVADIAGGTQIDVIGEPGGVTALRTESRERAKTFPFAGAMVTVADP